MAEIVNREIQKLERANARLPNGEFMDMYSLRPEVLLYGTSIEGDDYIKGPLFYAPGDAIIHALSQMFTSITIGPATGLKEANNKSTTKFHFESPLRLKEYRLDSQIMFYDATQKTRPGCMDVGLSNFKTTFYHQLTFGNKANGSPAQVPIDELMDNIVNGRTTIIPVRSESLFFCAPGKAMRIEKSYRIDMGTLWTFYVDLLSKGYTPQIIRNEAFIGPKSKIIIPKIITDMQIPSTIGALPEPISKAIEGGQTVNQIYPVCQATVLGQKSCKSGVFFQRLWQRDVPRIRDVYGKSYPIDRDSLMPRSFDHFTDEANLKSTKAWFYQEDFQPDAGRDALAYNWNYNRFLDVNTIVAWLLRKMSVRPDKETMYNFGGRPAALSNTLDQINSIVKHFDQLEDLDRIKIVEIYDVMAEVKMIFAVSATNPYGLIIRIQLLATTARTTMIRQRLWAFLGQLIANWKSLFPLLDAPADLMNRPNDEMKMMPFNPADQRINGVAVNWLLLPIIANLLRFAIGQLEFAFVAFS